MTIHDLEIGQEFTIDGHYERRSFLQFLRREQRQLRKYMVMQKNAARAEYQETK